MSGACALEIATRGKNVLIYLPIETRGGNRQERIKWDSGIIKEHLEEGKGPINYQPNKNFDLDTLPSFRGWQ